MNSFNQIAFLFFSFFFGGVGGWVYIAQYAFSGQKPKFYIHSSKSQIAQNLRKMANISKIE